MSLSHAVKDLCAAAGLDPSRVGRIEIDGREMRAEVVDRFDNGTPITHTETRAWREDEG